MQPDNKVLACVLEGLELIPSTGQKRKKKKNRTWIKTIGMDQIINTSQVVKPTKARERICKFRERFLPTQH